ncbi:biopolymer transporter ExbD [Wohlfahrtiimonas sp. G9077]|uniref:biopolymer transporter ExbD n=1 Tax=Wohlfahrtiimonas sp. G9077 TaxID=1980118 RepID=UPI000B990092|nr:biopolymer transporter ExbD [Wohlfahrtiimonas sp. G9077]OYQ74599.1 biopolymer transporter ExbD [Wohlfahrtiimonas sp. G9077]
MRRSRRKGNGKGLQAEMNIVPYVDVMFVLLTIFMVTATTIPLGVDIDTPEMESDVNYDEVVDDYLMVSIDKLGQYYFSELEEPDQALSLDQLEAEVKSFMQQKPNARIFLRSDKDTPYGNLIDAMSRLGRATGKSVQLTTPVK